MNNRSTIPISDEIWKILKETQENLKSASASQKELSASQKETDQQLKELSAELSASQKELSASQKETDRQLQKIGGRFNERWGRLVESLVEGNLVQLLRARGIEVRQTSQRVEVSYEKNKDDIQRQEFDIIAVNGIEVVAVEVKTVLNPKEVNRFLETLQSFKLYFPDYKNKIVYAAVAYLKSENKAHFVAEEKGLFVIRATGDSASIINKKDFKPKSFA